MEGLKFPVVFFGHKGCDECADMVHISEVVIVDQSIINATVLAMHCKLNLLS